MKNHRLFLVSFMAISLTLLTGFEKAGIDHALSQEKPLSQKSKKRHHKHLIAVVNKGISLDLSIPSKQLENVWETIDPNEADPKESANIFTSVTKKKMPSVYLNGQVLMSQEPE